MWRRYDDRSRMSPGIFPVWSPGTLVGMSFDRPAPDLQKLVAAWEQFEAGEETPGRVLANLKTAGLADVLRELVESGWTPSPAS
jgi:hypothetical protein